MGRSAHTRGCGGQRPPLEERARGKKLRQIQLVQILAAVLCDVALSALQIVP